MGEIRYPIGIQTFEDIIEGGFLYIDKTSLVHSLVKRNRYVLLSRPRRFGKSLLLSTIEAYFQGRRELFQGLSIEHLEKEWETYPVFRLDLSMESYESVEKLTGYLHARLSQWEEQYDIKGSVADSPAIRFENVIRTAAKKTGRKVVVLIDEYDKPIIDVLHDRDLQEQMRQRLQGFYSVIKGSDEYIRFVMVTGVGKFAHLSIFSGFNNLDDITMTPEYGSICGITEVEMHRYLAPSAKAFAQAHGIPEEDVWALFKKQYDGYHFCLPSEDIYNPFSVLSAFGKKDIDDYWFRSATPSMLWKLVRRNHFPLFRLERPVRSRSELLDVTDTDTDLVPLLFQSGYLTIRGRDESGQGYVLDFPNGEVRRGFWSFFTRSYFPVRGYSNGFETREFLRDVERGDADSFMERLQALFSASLTGGEPGLEIHFQNMMATVCMMLGLTVRTEIHSAKGRCDMTVETPGYIYIFEFKIDGSAEAALAQIRDRGYARRYMADGRRKVLVGADFSTKERTITRWVTEGL